MARCLQLPARPQGGKKKKRLQQCRVHIEDATAQTFSILQDLQRFLLALLHLLPPGPTFLEVLNDGVRGHGNLSHYGVTLDCGAMRLRCDVRERGMIIPPPEQRHLLFQQLWQLINTFTGGLCPCGRWPDGCLFAFSSLDPV